MHAFIIRALKGVPLISAFFANGESHISLANGPGPFARSRQDQPRSLKENIIWLLGVARRRRARRRRPDCQSTILGLEPLLTAPDPGRLKKEGLQPAAYG